MTLVKKFGSPLEPFLPLAISRESWGCKCASTLNTLTGSAMYARAMTPDSIEKIKNLSDDLIVKEVED
jgi:hypothetical protein